MRCAEAYHKARQRKGVFYGREEASYQRSQKYFQKRQNAYTRGVYQPLDQDDQSNRAREGKSVILSAARLCQKGGDPMKVAIYCRLSA